MSYPEKVMIELFLKKNSHKSFYPSDVADELNLSYEVVYNVFNIFLKEGKVALGEP